MTVILRNNTEIKSLLNWSWESITARIAEIKEEIGLDVDKKAYAKLSDSVLCICQEIT